MLNSTTLSAMQVLQELQLEWGISKEVSILQMS